MGEGGGGGGARVHLWGPRVAPCWGQELLRHLWESPRAGSGRKGTNSLSRRRSWWSFDMCVFFSLSAFSLLLPSQFFFLYLSFFLFFFFFSILRMEDILFSFLPHASSPETRWDQHRFAYQLWDPVSRMSTLAFGISIMLPHAFRYRKWNAFWVAFPYIKKKHTQ